jgi:hypothetical protein
MTPRPVTAAVVFSLPSVLFPFPLVFAPLSVLAVVFATEPSNQCATDCTQTWEDQIADETSSRSADEAVCVG